MFNFKASLIPTLIVQLRVNFARIGSLSSSKCGEKSDTFHATIKVNCDGTWLKETGQGGYDLVARDFAGIFKAVGGMGNFLCESSLMAEAEGVRAALLAWIESLM